MRYTLPEIAAAVWLPVLAGLLTAGATWLVWFYSAVHCTPANAVALMCEATPLGRYLTSAILHDCIIHGSIAMTLTGGSDIMLFLQERRRNANMAELLKASEERAAEERRLAAEERRLYAEERQLYAEERQRAEQRVEEQHQALMGLIARLADAIDRDRNGHSPPQS